MSNGAPQATGSAAGKPGRNDRCPCGSGRKYKHCCGGAPAPRGPELRTLLQKFSADAASLVDTFQRTATDSAIEALRRMRRELVQLLRNADPDPLATLWPDTLEKLHSSLMTSGLRDLTRSEADDALFAELQPARSTEIPSHANPGILASLMLLGRSFEVPIAKDLEKVTGWIREAYLCFLLETIEVHNRLGDADRYVDYLCALTDLVHDYVIRKHRQGSEAFVQQLGLLYVTRINLIQAYFNTRNLRQLYEQRADLTVAAITAQGGHTLCAFTPRPHGAAKIRLGIFAVHLNPLTETYFTLSHFEHLDRARFDITLYVLHSNHSSIEQHCVAHADRIVVLPTNGLNPQARRIREDDLDILLISTNMSAVSNTATQLGGYRLARIQISSVSSPVTTGGRHMDVMLSAEWNEPAADAQEHYTEHLELLPESVNYYAFQFDVDPATVNVNLSQIGVPSDSLVMFSGANFYKIIPELSRTWVRILAAVPNSVLLLMPFNANWSSSYKRLSFLTRIKQQLGEFNLDPGRIKVIDPVPTRADVHRVIASAQIYLDAYPFAGACSMLDPIIVGVPPVVRSGVVGRSNHGASLMRMVGLEEMICDSEDAYLTAALDLAKDPGKRAQVRAALLDHANKNPPVYFDTALFSQRVGRALAGIYTRYCDSYARLAGLPPSQMRPHLQALADEVVGRNFELNQLTDLGIVTALIEPFFRNLRESGTHHMIDVGACYGAMAAPLLQQGWSADLFEPDPDARAVLERNTAAWQSKCRIHSIAISNADAPEATFHKATQHGLSGLGDSPYAPTESLIKVPCMGLGQFYEKHQIRVVDFLKIDAEGFDFEVLESHDFGTIQPRLILVEYGTHFARQTLQIVNAAAKRMAGFGYGAIVFNYTQDGDFKLGQWNYRLTEMFVDSPIPELGRNAFGNILFYRLGDSQFLLTLNALLDTCRRPDAKRRYLK